MATFKNISRKVINIGTTAILPDSTIELGDTVANSSSVRMLKKRGFLAEVVVKKTTKATRTVSTGAEDSATTVTTTAKKRGRKASSEAVETETATAVETE